MTVSKKKRLVEAAVLLLVLGLGVAWLLLRPWGKVNYKIPKFSALAVADITSVTWEKEGGERQIVRKQGDKWLITDKGYPVSSGRLEDLLQQLSRPELGDLVADQGPYQKYGLDEKERFLLQAHSGETISRSLLVGKASSGNYSYVALSDQPQVYLLRANLTGVLESKIDDLREKQVLVFDATAVTGLKIEGGEKVVSLSKTSKQDGSGGNVDAWQDETGKEFDRELVKTTLDRLSSLYASAFTEQEPAGKLYHVTVSGNAFSHQLTVAEEPQGKDEGEGYLSRVSGYDFPFLLSSYTVGSFLEDFGFVEAKKAG